MEKGSQTYHPMAGPARSITPEERPYTAPVTPPQKGMIRATQGESVTP